MAVGGERTQAARVGECRRLLVGRLGGADFGRAASGMYFADENQRGRLEPACLALSSCLQCQVRVMPGLIEPCREQIGHAEPPGEQATIPECPSLESIAGLPL